MESILILKQTVTRTDMQTDMQMVLPTVLVQLLHVSKLIENFY